MWVTNLVVCSSTANQYICSHHIFQFSNPLYYVKAVTRTSPFRHDVVRVESPRSSSACGWMPFVYWVLWRQLYGARPVGVVTHKNLCGHRGADRACKSSTYSLVSVQMMWDFLTLTNQMLYYLPNVILHSSFLFITN
jgi:hypothetical protein